MAQKTVAKKKSPYEVFLDERSSILNDIKQFLHIVLSFQQESIKLAGVSLPGEDVQKFIKSLCLIHALYGYPGEGNVLLNSY